MKKLTLASVTITLSLILVGCNSDTSEGSNNTQSDNTDNQAKTEEKNKDDAAIEESKNNEVTNDDKTEASREDNTNKNESEEKQTKNNKESYLADFSSKEIEYARIWEQLGPMKNNMKGMDTLYVKEIPKGSKVNPQAENSAVYQEDVVKLEAPIKAGGSVTYSSNGDGTINVYNKVPYRWADSQMSDYSNMDEVTKKAIEENIETVDVKPTDNKTIAELASKIEYSK
uniref:Lipoprotein n=1 Tax=Staphylococcus arlettae TaxID=29378 RepID=A0A1W5QDZ7_9STAP|nr:hypothetical protein [Staphylococcus arlettae]